MKPLLRLAFFLLIYAEPVFALDALIERMTTQAAISEAQAKRALEAAFDAIVAELQAGRVVGIDGFGKFYVREMGPRTGRNPRTGQPIMIEARRYPRFTASEKFKLRVRLPVVSQSAVAAPGTDLVKDLKGYLNQRLP